LSDEQYSRAQTVLNRFELPELGAVAPARVLEIVAHDKKNINGKLSFILIDDIGNGVISTDVTADDIIDSLSVVA
jgi:3-dehydroquinate synthetase